MKWENSKADKKMDKKIATSMKKSSVKKGSVSKGAKAYLKRVGVSK